MNERHVAVSVPATCANLGPGYDFLGAALEWRDDHQAWVSSEVAGEAGPEVQVNLVGGAEDADVATDASNLVAASLLRGLQQWGQPTPARVTLECRNEIPHGRGLGSSSAAIVAGLGLAQALCPPGQRPLADELFALAAAIEGHPDNVAPAIWGGFTPTWSTRDGSQAVRLTPNSEVHPVVAVPDQTLPTSKARQMMPVDVPLAEATFNASRAALLCLALISRPDLLLPATDDVIHQPRRAPAYPASFELVRRLRDQGFAAVISGAGPTVLVLATGDAADHAATVAREAGDGWMVRPVPFASEGLILRSAVPA